MPVEVVPHGVDFDAFQSVKHLHARYEARRSLWPNEPDRREWAWIGNFNRNHSCQKLAITLEGFARARSDKVPNVRLYLHWGAERTGPDLMREARPWVSQVMSLFRRQAGQQRDIGLLYWSMDVGINTPIGEGWELSAFEHGAIGARRRSC